MAPPISVHPLGKLCEAQWSPAEMPLAYGAAPLIIHNAGRSDLPGLARLAEGVQPQRPVVGLEVAVEETTDPHQRRSPPSRRTALPDVCMMNGASRRQNEHRIARPIHPAPSRLREASEPIPMGKRS